MPFYVYECKAGHQTEGLCSIEDRDKPVPCSTCGKKKTKRIATPVAGIVRNPAVPRSKQ
jgi:putative FmdB family regulatory protein